jgi:spermidine synthase
VDPSSRHDRPPLLSIGLVSAAALAYEILLMRLFSIIQWHHFAYMMISLALLGFGASGTFLALVQRRLKGRFALAFIVNAAAFAVASVTCFLAAQSLPFNALEVMWDPRQPLWLMLVYLLLFIPFFCAANCICLSFSNYPRQLHRVYSADLLGAGLGAAGAVGVLFLVMPLQALGVIGLLGWATVAAACRELRVRQRSGPLLALCGALLCAWPLLHSDLKLSQFKGLAQALRVSGALQVDQRSGPLGLLSTVENRAVPFRHVPGMSLNSPLEPPAQKAVFTDGDGMSVITRFDGTTAPLAYLDYTTGALPYHLLDRPNVLVLGAGGGADVLQALHAGASTVDAVELNPQVVDLVRSKFGQFGGAVYAAPRVSVHQREARGFVAGSERRYGLIQLALLDSFAASSAGLYALSESYLYTVEAFGIFLDHLEPGGILSVTRWLKVPPRDGLKVFATAVEALQRRGVDDPGAHLAMIRSWNTTTLLVGETAFSAAQRAALRAFCAERWFDLAWVSGMDAGEANRFNLLPEPWFFLGVTELLGGRQATFHDQYKFNVRPATDDRPHFFHFFKWRTLPEILALRGQGGLPLLEQGYLLLVATLVQAVIASLALILLPLALTRGPAAQARVPRARILAYFLAVGMAFMLVEIAFIQKFILFLAHPLYAVAVVLAGFLVFAGLGSAWSRRWSNRPMLGRIVAGIIGLAALYLLALPGLFAGLAHLADAWKVLCTLILIAPLAWLMGMPFPLGLDRVAREAPGWIPWAWGVNGCASVVSAVLATVLAIHAGFVVVVITALGLYGLAGGLAWRQA